jgi:simple sugar transport system permease protein
MDIAFWLGNLTFILAATWRLATPMIYAGIGETFAERGGVINIGLEGIMLCGALAAYLTALYTNNLLWSLLVPILVGLVWGLLFAFFTVTIKANQIVVGTAVNLIGLGLTGFVFRSLITTTVRGSPTVFSPIDIPGLAQLPFIGDILFRHNAMVYATILLVPLASFVLYRTAFGLSLRAAGEHPRAADTAGINVNAIRYAGTMLGAILTSVGGAYLSIAQTNVFGENMADGRGFIALAVVVFGRWTPLGVMGASLLFGLFFALELRLQVITGLGVPYQLFQAMPYVVTILAFLGLRGRSTAPKALATPYEK